MLRRVPPRSKPISARSREARLARVREALDEVRARCDVGSRVSNDPIEFVHRYEALEDREIVALLASAMAFGNVKALRGKIEDALARIGPDVARASEDLPGLSQKLHGWKHRVYRADDLARLLAGARAVQRAAGSLGQALARELDRTGDLRAALIAWTSAIRTAGGLGGDRRGGTHILADPAKGSAVKRLMLLLRWMARPADGIDLGLWPIPPSALVIPVDVHIHKLANNLDLTRRKDVSWRTAEEITQALARFDPADPVKYDFSLCHLGMVQHCPSRRDEARCEGCGVKRVCRHWARG